MSDVYLKASQEKEEKKKYSSEARSIFGLGTNFFERETDKIESIFAIPIKSDPKSFTKKCNTGSNSRLQPDI